MFNDKQGQLTFSWNPVLLDCPCTDVHYDILTSNCGTCIPTTTNTTVTCTNVPTDGMCTFAVRAVICNLTGNISEPVTFTLKGIHCQVFIAQNDIVPIVYIYSQNIRQWSFCCNHCNSICWCNNSTDRISHQDFQNIIIIKKL